ncbi:TPA: hypothetical protein ACYLN4_000619 [Burkholderia lata]
MDILSACQLLSIMMAVIWVRLRCSNQAIAALVGVAFANAFLTGFEMQMGTEYVTWQQIFSRQVDADTLSTLLFGGLMYAAVIAMFVVFVGLQINKVLIATSDD